MKPYDNNKKVKTMANMKFSFGGWVTFETKKGILTIDNNFSGETIDGMTPAKADKMMTAIKKQGVPLSEYDNSECPAPYMFTDNNGNTWCCDTITEEKPKVAKPGPAGHEELVKKLNQVKRNIDKKAANW